MGTFMGHVLPGSLFFLYGLWTMYNVFTRYFLSQKAATLQEHRGGGQATSYRNVCSFKFSCCPRIPLEGLLKVSLTLTGIIGELATAFRDGEFVNYENAHHITMYFFFGLAGIFDIVSFWDYKTPPNMDYVANILAFSMEALIFGNHLSDRTPMDQQVHTFLLYLVFGCAISLSFEMVYKENVLPALMRTYFILMQGTWFTQIGFILFKPLTTPWDQSGPRHMMLISLIFCWHFAGVFVGMSLVGWLIHLRVKRMSSTSIYYELTQRTTQNADELVRKMTQEEVRVIFDESEEEV